MCDTFAYRFTVDGNKSTWFGKNSDREPNEAHEVIFVSGKTNPTDSFLKCTYIEIPQVDTTYDVILCKPVWIWGAEMGINQHGVAIGNEAVFTKGPQPKTPALTGMDLLRLALERSHSAREAVDCITGLLAAFGQGGNCGFSHPFYYNNSFLIADRKETWVLETVGREWAAKCFEAFTAISNGLSIETDWDLASQSVNRGDNFARSKSDKIMTHFSEAGERRSCVLDSLRQLQPGDSIQRAFQALRSHGASNEIPTGSLITNSVCMHAGFGPIRIDQTTGSMVVEMSESETTIWITGTSAPCLSVFQPVRFADFHTDTVISSEANWRENEIFHRQALFCHDNTRKLFARERDNLETSFIAFARQGTVQPEILLTCEPQKAEFLRIWTERVSNESGKTGSILFRNAWNKFNREGGFPLPVL